MKSQNPTFGIYMKTFELYMHLVCTNKELSFRKKDKFMSLVAMSLHDMHTRMYHNVDLLR